MVELGYYAIGSGLQGSVEVRRAGGREGGRHRTSAAHTTTNERSERRRSGGCGRKEGEEDSASASRLLRGVFRLSRTGVQEIPTTRSGAALRPGHHGVLRGTIVRSGLLRDRSGSGSACVRLSLLRLLSFSLAHQCTNHLLSLSPYTYTERVCSSLLLARLCDYSNNYYCCCCIPFAGELCWSPTFAFNSLAVVALFVRVSRAFTCCP